MKKLFDTQLLKLLHAKGTFNPADADITPLYEDFVHSVISLCISRKGDIPAYFTLHYTFLELETFQSGLSIEGAGKKCADYKLHQPLPFIYNRFPAMGRG